MHSILDWSIEYSKGLVGIPALQFELCTSMTANQLHAHAAQILRFSACENNIHPASVESGSLQQDAALAVVACATTITSGGGGGGSGGGGCSTTVGAATPASSGGNKRKRRPAGTPDPDAEVVALSPETLMESDRYVCEICNQGFQRDQNLQMHRRRHKVPWKLVKKASSMITQKRVYVCPELTCLHHDPSHALGDLVGIKKHFRRKHCNEKRWVCDKCSKGYAVQSDYKAHLKTCGTRGHCCDCGRVFSRVESFIEHQDMCNAAKLQKGSMQGENEKNLKKSTFQQSSPTARRNVSSNESPSQSSDTTAVPFANSGISDNTARSADSSRLNEQVSTRFESNSHEAASTAVGPTWLEERRCNALQQLLPSGTQALQRLESYSESAFAASSAPHDMRLQTLVSASRSHQSTRCSSKNSALCPEMSFSDCKSLTPCCRAVDDGLNTPSLQLTIGPYSESAEVISIDRVSKNVTIKAGSIDRKPNLDGVDRFNVVAMSSYQQLQAQAAGETPVLKSGSKKGIGEDLALSFPENAASVQQPVRNEAIIGEGGKVTETVTNMKVFRATEGLAIPLRGESKTRAQEPINVLNQQETARVRSLYPGSPVLKTRSASSILHAPSYAGGSDLKSQDVDLERRLESETVGEDLIWAQRTSIVQLQRPQAIQRSTPEPADNSGPIVHDNHARDLQRDVTQSEFLIVACAFEGAADSRQKELATTACVEANKAREQARTEMKSAWSDLAAARRTKEQARLESSEAQNEIARAELLKREAREQLQQASAEKAYADHARDMAKRQMDMAEAELADAKRMRERAQVEMDTSRLILKEQSECSSVDAIIRASSRDQSLRNSSYICQICKSEGPVGRDLSLGLQQTSRMSMQVQSGFVSSQHWPATTDHKILLLQNASNEISNNRAGATGLVNYFTVRESTFEAAGAKYCDNNPNPTTRLLSHINVGESSTCRRWSSSLAGVAGRDGRSSPPRLSETSRVPTFATGMSCTLEATGSLNPRTSTDPHSQSGS